MNEQSKLLSARELAEVLGISTPTVYQQARRGQLPCYKFGDRVMFRLEEVLAAARVSADDNGRKGGA